MNRNNRKAKKELSRIGGRLSNEEAHVPAERRRLGFLEAAIEVPDDFNRIGEREIAALFESGTVGTLTRTPARLYHPSRGGSRLGDHLGFP